MQQAGYVFGEAVFGVVDGLVADDLPGVGDAPELSGVVRDAVEDVERDAVFVFYLLSLYGLAEQLLHVALADIAGELADVAFWPRVVFGADAVSQSGVVGPLVPLRGLIGTRRNHPPHALLPRELVDALHHVHVAPLAPVERLGTVAFRLQVPTMDHRIHIRKQGFQRGVLFREQVAYLDPFDIVARGVHLPDVYQPQVIALPEGRQELACYVACGARQQDAPALLSCMRVAHFVESQVSSPRSKAVPIIYSHSPASRTRSQSAFQLVSDSALLVSDLF